MPLLKYILNTYEPVSDELDDLIITKFENGKPYKLNIRIKNIGLNNIKKIKIDFKSDIIKNDIERIIGKNTIVLLEKGEEIIVRKLFSLPVSEEPYRIELILYYQDVLSNWYRQILEISYIATNEVIVGGPVGRIEYIINEEELIEENNK